MSYLDFPDLIETVDLGSDWVADDGTLTDETTPYTDGDTGTGEQKLGKNPDDGIKLTYNTGFSVLAVGDTFGIFATGAHNWGEAALLAYTDSNSVTATGKIVTSGYSSGQWNDVTVTQAFLDQLGDQGSGKFSVRWVPDNNGTGDSETSEVRQTLTLDSTIQASGGDYTTMASHWADQPATFIRNSRGLLADEEFVTTNVNLGGKTPDGFLVTYLPQAGKGFKDTVQALFFSTTGARLTNTVDYGSILAVDNIGNIGEGVAIIGLQAKNTSGNYGGETFEIQGGNLVQDCIGESDRDLTNFRINETNTRAANCLAVSTRDSSQSGFNCAYSSMLFNCTAIDLTGGTTNTGFERSSGTPKLVNCCAFDANLDFTASGWDTGSKNNASDGTNAPGANPQDSLTFADQFINTASDFKLKAGSGLETTGDTDATHAPNDILGTVRASGTDGDIGCHEFVSAGVAFLASQFPRMNQAVHRASLH